MRNDNKKSVKPKTGTTHAIFGSRYLKLHDIRDPNWSPEDKFSQYTGLALLHEKDQFLASLKSNAKRKLQLQKLHEIRTTIKTNRDYLKIALFGDIQRTKNVLQKRKDLQRLYKNMAIHEIVDNIDQRTFSKRKELDRMISKRNQLIKKYEMELLNLSKIQDRKQFVDANKLKTDLLAKAMRLKMSNCETRLRALRNIQIGYIEMINRMIHDSLYFNPVLKALQEDIIEQEDFINTTIQLGLPVMYNVKDLNRNFKSLDQKTRKEMSIRMKSLTAYNRTIQDNNDNVKKLVRRDSDFELFTKRYDRETSSMLDLKLQLDKIEKDMKLIRNVTFCKSANEVYTRIRKHVRDSENILSNVNRRETELFARIEQKKHANAIQEIIEHNLTEDETKELLKIEELKKEIFDENSKQISDQKMIENKKKIIDLLRGSFQHVADVLRHIGDPNVNHFATKKSYTNMDLKLPLLDFVAFSTKQNPPQPMEENVSTLLNIIKERVSELMHQYSHDKSQTELVNATKVFHNHVILDLYGEAIGGDSSKPEHESLLDDGVSIEDPAVLTRDQIKKNATKICALNAKKED